VPPGGAGGGLDFGLVTVADIYDESSVLDFGPLGGTEGKTLRLGARRRKVDDMHRGAAHVTGQLGQGIGRDHDLYRGWARLRGRCRR